MPPVVLDEVGYEILDYLRSHPDEDTTVKFLAETLNLTLSQTRSRVEKFEYRGLVKRHRKRLFDRCGVERTNYVYKWANLCLDLTGYFELSSLPKRWELPPEMKNSSIT